DGGFEAGDVVALAGHGVPPKLLDVALEFRAERAIIPEAVEAAVNLGRLKHKPAPLAQRHDFFHLQIFFWFGHRISECLAKTMENQSRRVTDQEWQGRAVSPLTAGRVLANRRRARSDAPYRSHHPSPFSIVNNFSARREIHALCVKFSRIGPFAGFSRGKFIGLSAFLPVFAVGTGIAKEN